MLRDSDMVTADGFPIIWLSRIMGKPLTERVCGSDLVPALAQSAASRGLSLFLFYGENQLPEVVQQELARSPDRIFPYFIATEIPLGISGLFIAAIFAAAISTLDSALTESSDLTVNHIYVPLVNPVAEERHYVLVSRLAMVVWGGIFYLMAVQFAELKGEGLLDLTFKLPNYVYGAIFGMPPPVSATAA